MAVRITTYAQAFALLDIDFSKNEAMKIFVARMEKEGHTEKSICFTIWKKQDKLNAFRNDSRFLSILQNEINKWSWRKDDPRWQEYWKRKEEERKAEAIRQELATIKQEEYEFEQIEKRSKRKYKGYVYFIQGQCGGAIKVGFSVNPKLRLRELQTGYPDTLLILAIIPGTPHTEAVLHKKFEASRLKGEWFRPDDYVIQTIKELKEKYASKKTSGL